jgi:hypothetical protein
MAEEDWKLRFAKERYTKLLEILSNRMDEKELGEVLRELGAYCAGLGDEFIMKYRDDFEGFRAFIKKSASGDDIVYDRQKGIIEMASADRTECFCPLIGDAHGAPGAACGCSLGWHEHTWTTLLEKPVRVELKESVLRGGKRCVFEIAVGGADQA